MKTLKSTLVAGLMLISTATYASCDGRGSSYTCNEASGNSYNVQKFGNTTNMQGYNASTGSNTK